MQIVDLEEELRVIGENLKALEVAEEKAQQREEEYKKQIRDGRYSVLSLDSVELTDVIFHDISTVKSHDTPEKPRRTLTDRLKSAESRAEYGEKTVQKLNLRIDNIMFDLVAEKMKTQNVNDELDQTFDLFINQ